MTRPLALVLLAGVSTLLGGEAHRRTEKGNAAYLKGKNDAALEEYQKAQTVLPEAPQLHYDLGNVLYREENWAGAAEAYERALGAAGPDLAPRAAFNLGNALFQDGKYDDAVKAYTRALKVVPEDADAKRNLELALRAIQQQKKQPKPQPQQQQQGDKKQDGQQQSQGSDKDDKKDDKKDRKPDAPQGEDLSQQPKPDAKDGRMTAEQANELLDRLGNEERRNLKKEQARRGKGEPPDPEKDW